MYSIAINDIIHCQVCMHACKNLMGNRSYDIKSFRLRREGAHPPSRSHPYGQQAGDARLCRGQVTHHYQPEHPPNKNPGYATGHRLLLPYAYRPIARDVINKINNYGRHLGGPIDPEVAI